MKRNIDNISNMADCLSSIGTNQFDPKSMLRLKVQEMEKKLLRLSWAGLVIY